MINYILFSIGFHVLCLILLGHAPGLNTSPAPSNVEINIVEHPKKVNDAPILQKSPTRPKYAKLGERDSKVKKEQKVDMMDYANQLKAKVDPVFVAKNRGQFGTGLQAIISFYPKQNGEITNIRVLRSSGNKNFDRMCIDTLLEVGFIPPPPAELTVKGVEWTFGV